MNITPTLPNPNQPPAQQERQVVGVVQATRRTRDAADEAAHQPPARRPQSVDGAERDRLQARAETLATPHTGYSTHINRALSSYASVADDGERSSLKDMLGFDAYA